MFKIVIAAIVFMAFQVPAQATDFSTHPHRLDVEVYAGALNQATLSATSYSTAHPTLGDCQNRMTDLGSSATFSLQIPGAADRPVGVKRIMHCTLITK